MGICTSPLTLVSFTLALSALPLVAQDASTLLSKAGAIVRSIDPGELQGASFDKVECLTVIPKNSRSAFILGAQERKGIQTCRTQGEWSTPLIVTTRMVPDARSSATSALSEDMIFLSSESQRTPSSWSRLDNLPLQDGTAALVLWKESSGTFGGRSTPKFTIKPETRSAESDSLLTSSFLRDIRMLDQRIPTPSGASPPAMSAPPPPAAAAPKSPPRAGMVGEGRMPRVTGTHPLVSGENEKPGFGLYSYALFAHAPSDDELPAFRSFFTALLALPTSGSLGRTLQPARINETEIPVNQAAASWDFMSVQDRVKFVLDHYDYGRAAAILACLPERTRTGPVIISVLAPIDVSKHPRPVLVEDLSLAQPALMRASVDHFVAQASEENFWQESLLATLALKLRNALEVSAVALGMSRKEVTEWIKMTPGT
ncbi:hypothetical protein [Granulicella sp. dw_53]|uniref:hypothetical protein n=1 Tax=Granulicella sp. dw_53 TaxID=2719792 RepID=UPI001BD41FDD|nr:hypothetical protein [Granulicella sp. dw_53]